VLLKEDIGAVRRLTLDRPEVLNALNVELVELLSDALREAEGDDDVRVVIIRGSGRAFCSGYDLKEEATEGKPRSVTEWRDAGMASVAKMLEIFDLEKPVIAEVHGYCLAGGCDLMMMCDIAVASEDAVFGEPEIRFGSGVVTMVMPWLIGARRAKALLFTGDDRLDAEEALRIGLVNKVVRKGELEDATLELAHRIAASDPAAVALTKRAVNRSWEAAGFRQALQDGAYLAAEIEAAEVPERKEFDRISAEQGLRAAIEWRDSRYAGSS